MEVSLGDGGAVGGQTEEGDGGWRTGVLGLFRYPVSSTELAILFGYVYNFFNIKNLPCHLNNATSLLY